MSPVPTQRQLNARELRDFDSYNIHFANLTMTRIIVLVCARDDAHLNKRDHGSICNLRWYVVEVLERRDIQAKDDCQG